MGFLTFKTTQHLKLYLVFSMVILLISSVPLKASEIGEFEAQFRTFYFNRDKSGLADSEAATQALMLRYRSPYFADVIGVNASVFTNLKLYGEDGNGGTGLLRDGDSGSQSSYLKLAEIYAKFKLPNDSKFDIGRMKMGTPLLNDSDSRATPSTTQAAYLRLNFQGTEIYALASDRGSTKTNTQFESYEDSTGDDYIVYVAGVMHEFDNSLKLHLAAGHADNVMQQAYLSAKYPIQINDDIGLNLDGHQYFGWNEGDGALLGVGPDYESSLTNIGAQIAAYNAKVTVSYQKVSGDTYILPWNKHDETDYSAWHNVTRMDFNRGGESSWQLRFDYDLKDYLAGLKIMARYTSGHDIKGSASGSEGEWERDIDISYSPPMIENLSFKWRNAYVKSSETYNSHENRFIVNYAIKY